MSKWNSLDKFIAKIRYRKVKRYVPKKKGGGVICDIGCGQEAAFLFEISNIIKKGYGFDFKAKNYRKNNILVYNNKNINGRINIKEKSCDTVFLLAVLEHLEKPEQVLKDCNRILKPNGKIVLTTPTKLAKPILEFMAFKLHIINEDEILEHKHYYSKKEIKELLKSLKYRNIDYKIFSFGVNSLIVAEK